MKALAVLAVAMAGIGTLGASAGFAAAAPLPVEDVTVMRSTDQYDIEVHYPKTGVATIDDAISTWATGLVDDFVKQAEEDFASFGNDTDRPALTYSLDLAYDVPRNDDAVFVVDFDESIFTGGAHPNHDVETFNFLMPDGWQVFLPEIFDRLAIERISRLAVADLVRQFDGPDSMSDDDWLKTGAGPDWDNFKDFLLLPDTLAIRFPPYQVAAYAAGDQEVEIPLSELEGLTRTNWRTPVPSFDCAKAGTPPEKAVCSDVTLARLDREVDGAYRLKLLFADAADRNAVRNEQRAWIETRNSCGSSLLCLTESYATRLKALQEG